MGNPTEERAVFGAFVAIEPNFAGAPVKTWNIAPKDPPDVECELQDGRKIGVELTSWLDEDQIADSKSRESLEAPFRELFFEEPNNTESFWLVTMEVKNRLRAQDAQAFKSGLLQLLAKLDAEHSGKPDWEQRPYFNCSDFTSHATLLKYLESLEIHPREEAGKDKGSLNWITFALPGGFYSPLSMVDALCEQIQKKIDKYSGKPACLKQFDLLVHYDRAFAHNTPAIAPGFDYGDSVATAAKTIGSAVGAFDQIWVYVNIGAGHAFRLYPLIG